MLIELKGKLGKVYDVEVISEKMSKKEIVVTIGSDTEYPQGIICEAINKKIDVLDGYKIGDSVIVKCDLRGRESKGKQYNKLVVVSIFKN